MVRDFVVGTEGIPEDGSHFLPCAGEGRETPDGDGDKEEDKDGADDEAETAEVSDEHRDGVLLISGPDDSFGGEAPTGGR